MKLYTVRSKFFDVTGVVFPARYAEDRWALALHDEEEPHPDVLSVNLVDYGLEQPPGHVHVGTYSQYEGLPHAVEAAGLATRVGDEAIKFGPYDASAFLMKLSDDVVAAFEETS